MLQHRKPKTDKTPTHRRIFQLITTQHTFLCGSIYSRITSRKSPHFVWQPSTWASCTVRSSYPIYVIPVTMYTKEYSALTAGHTDLRAHDFADCPDLWHQLRLTKITCAWSWRLCEINAAIHSSSSQISLALLTRCFQWAFLNNKLWMYENMFFIN